MSLKVKFLKMLGELNAEEKVQMRELFGVDEPPEILEPESIPEQVPSLSADQASAVPSEVEKTPEAETQPKLQLAEEAAPQPTEAEPQPSLKQPPIPKMVKSELSEEKAEMPIQKIVDQDGAEMPIDYQSVIDGLNAKMQALESENTRLKSKVEGAFGYSSKPQSPGKVNPLYNEDTANIHFRK